MSFLFSRNHLNEYMNLIQTFTADFLFLRDSVIEPSKEQYKILLFFIGVDTPYVHQ